MWDAVIPLLATDFTVVSYDLRGFGESSPMDLHFGYTHADDLAALLDHLGVARAALVGFSFGGQVALTMALEQPARVSRLVLVDSLVEGVRWDAETAEAMHAVTAALHDRGIDAAKQVWLAHPFFTAANERPQVAAGARGDGARLQRTALARRGPAPAGGAAADRRAGPGHRAHHRRRGRARRAVLPGDELAC